MKLLKELIAVFTYKNADCSCNFRGDKVFDNIKDAIKYSRKWQGGTKFLVLKKIRKEHYLYENKKVKIDCYIVNDYDGIPSLTTCQIEDYIYLVSKQEIEDSLED